MNAEQVAIVSNLVNEIIEGRVLYNPGYYFLLMCMAILAGATAYFVGAYLKTRGETMATKADFDELLSQLKKTTTATEDIRAAVSYGEWKRKERQTIRRMKLEELMLLLYEADHWIGKHGDFRLFNEKIDLPEDPRDKVEVIAALYFPEITEIHEFHAAYTSMVEWHTRIALERLKTVDVAAHQVLMDKIKNEYGVRRPVLLKALKKVQDKARVVMEDLLK